jgi:hypothetical protein
LNNLYSWDRAHNRTAQWFDDTNTIGFVVTIAALRDAIDSKARQAETGARMSEWLTSPGLRLPV